MKQKVMKNDFQNYPVEFRNTDETLKGRNFNSKTTEKNMYVNNL